MRDSPGGEPSDFATRTAEQSSAHDGFVMYKMLMEVLFNLRKSKPSMRKKNSVQNANLFHRRKVTILAVDMLVFEFEVDISDVSSDVLRS